MARWHSQKKNRGEVARKKDFERNAQHRYEVIDFFKRKAILETIMYHISSTYGSYDERLPKLCPFYKHLQENLVIFCEVENYKLYYEMMFVTETLKSNVIPCVLCNNLKFFY